MAMLVITRGYKPVETPPLPRSPAMCWCSHGAMGLHRRITEVASPQLALWMDETNGGKIDVVAVDTDGASWCFNPGVCIQSTYCINTYNIYTYTYCVSMYILYIIYTYYLLFLSMFVCI